MRRKFGRRDAAQAVIAELEERYSQKIADGVYGKSITDPCLGWADSEKLIRDLAGMA